MVIGIALVCLFGIFVIFTVARPEGFPTNPKVGRYILVNQLTGLIALGGRQFRSYDAALKAGRKLPSFVQSFIYVHKITEADVLQLQENAPA